MKFSIAYHNKKQTELATKDRVSCLIGSYGCDITLEDERCSPRHAEIYAARDKTLWIRVIGSNTGVYVNGNRVLSSPVRQGDKITVGSTTLVIANALFATLGDSVVSAQQ